MPLRFRGPPWRMHHLRQHPAHLGRNLRRRCRVLLSGLPIREGLIVRKLALKVDINIPLAAINRVDNIRAKALSHRLQVSLRRVPLFRLALIF